MKKTLQLLVALLVTATMNAQAVGDTFVAGDYEYLITSYDPNPNEVTLIGTTNAALTVLNIPSQALYSGYLPFIVTEIGTNASDKNEGIFKDNTTIETVTLPSTVTKIGHGAFLNCSNLQSINLDDILETGQNSLANCSLLDDIGTPDKLTRLEDYTFNNCVNLTTLEFPDLQHIGVGAIYNSAHSTSKPGGIREFDVPNSVTEIENIFLGGLWDLVQVQVNWDATQLGNLTMGPNNFFRFLDLSNIKLYVPAGTKEDYKAHAMWGLFFNEGVYDNIIEGEMPELLSTKEVALELGFNMYPNPTRDVVVIKNKQLRNAAVTVYDLNGRALLNKTISAAESQINISNLSNGIYLFKVKADNGEFTQRIVKQ
ncbi:leucine-rich repeat domain-containing protein [Seonamhaeicola sp.]|uniref:leucine-rich repeat domain-containing protein n=1 Tax=Seonamhaeicola sp. TaxID=1912245 RepID=UPI003569A363